MNQQHKLLSSFFRFKKWHERALIPLHTSIGVILTFYLFVPGEVAESPVIALMIFLLSLLGCFAAVRAENRKSFVKPLGELQAILNEYRE